MNEEEQVSYYSIIPATVRYDKKLKSAEKLLYGEITALANKNGYCFAKNKYFANLYGVTTHTVSQWVSNLEKQGFIYVELIKNERKEIEERRIYIRDAPYVQKNTYPYVLKSTYPMYEKVQDNIIKYNKDDLFYFIICKSDKISKEFYFILNKLDFLYTEEMISSMQKDKVKMIQDIIYVLYELYNSNFSSILLSIKRKKLLELYNLSLEHMPNDLLHYYKKTIINEYINSS